MAGNWGAILAGLAGGAGSLGQSMDTRATAALILKRQQAMDALAAQTANANADNLTFDNLMGAFKEGYRPVQAIAQGISGASAPLDTGGLSGGAILPTNMPRALQLASGLKNTIGVPSRSGAVTLGLDEDATPRAKDARSLATQERIATSNAKAAADRAAEAIAARFQMQGTSLTAAQKRAETMADAQRNAIAGTVNLNEGGVPTVTGYTRGGDTKKLGQAVPTGTGASRTDQALAAGEAARSYNNLLDPQTKKMMDPPGWWDRSLSKSDITNVLASDAGSAYMNNVRGLIRAWIVTVEGKRMSDADARINEVLKSFRFGGGKLADQQTKNRLEGMYKDITEKMGGGQGGQPAGANPFLNKQP